MILGVKRKILKEMVGYYVETTGKLPSHFILDVQKYHRGLGDTDYNVWLAGESFKVMAEKGIELIDVLKYNNISESVDTEGNIWLHQEIERVSEGIECRIDFTGDIRDFKDKSNLDYLNTFDIGMGITPFKDNMGEDFRKVVEENKGIYLNIEGTKKASNKVIQDEMLLKGYSEEIAKEIGLQNLYRIMQIKREYNLKNLRMGILLNVDIFKEEKHKEFLAEFYKEMGYVKGYCFEPKVINRRGRQTLLSYTVWDTQSDIRIRRSIEMQEILKEGSKVKKGKSRLIRADFEGLYDWINIGQDEKALGYVYASSNTLRMLVRIETVTEEPKGGYTKITQRNISQVAAANAVRVILKERVGLNPIVLNSPDTTVEGYTTWLANAIILFIYGNTLIAQEGKQNQLFPLSYERVQKTIEDKKIDNTVNNTAILELLEYASKYCGEEAQTLKMYVDKVITTSLQGDVRRQKSYKGGLGRADAGFNLIREYTPTIIDEDTYIGYIESLKEVLYEGIYTFGFISI